MADLASYLDMSSPRALSEWRSITARPPRPDRTGFRQVPFTPIETVLCLAASLLVNHRHFGGSTAHQAPTPVPELASLFRRTNASVLAKMANLDGSRTNGARHELQVSAQLLGSPSHLVTLYGLIIEAARSCGVGPQDLPDFLGLAGDGGFELVGQEEIDTTVLESELEPDVARFTAANGTVETEVTERLLVGAARVGQHRFATAVLHNCGRACVFCGLSPGPGMERSKLLLASHIKPWRDSAPRERLDHRNGVAACPTHDAAFDSGHLTVDPHLNIRVSRALSEARGRDQAMSFSFGQPPMAATLQLPATAEPPKESYLAWHRERIAAVA